MVKLMDWLFGGSNPQPPSSLPPTIPVPPPAGQPSNPLANLSSSAEPQQPPPKTDYYDPVVLERIASAARELQKSEHAKELLEVARESEKSWQAKHAVSRAEADVAAKERAIQLARIQGEEERATKQKEAEFQQANSRYQDQLARKRYEDQLSQQHQAKERELRLLEQSVLRQEEEKRRTLEYQEQLRRQTELARAKIEGEERIKQERENKDIREQQIVVQATEMRKTVLEGIRTAGEVIGQGFSNYIRDYKEVGTTVAAITALAIGVYAARSGTQVASQYVAARLIKPPLVRDTSRQSFLLHPVAGMKRLFTKPKPDSVLDGIILQPDLQKRLQGISIATARAHEYKADFRNFMLYGPPGTGKTMFAKRLAYQSGLDYAILAGGDVGPLGRDAVNELHRVFDWAKASRRGVLIFIDEADAFLRKRGTHGDGNMSEDLRNALSTFLYRSGEASNKFMLVFATNEPNALDRAVTDRVDEVIEFASPAVEERKVMMKHYFNQYILQAKGRPIHVSDDVNEALFAKFAEVSGGFSGRTISKLAHAWQAAAYESIDNTLTGEMMKKVMDSFAAQHQQKTVWDHTKLLSID